MYNSFMAMLQDLVSEFGLECSLLAPVAYCPLPYFKNLGTIAVFVGADFVFSVWKTLAALSKEWHGMDFFTAPMGLARDCLWLPNKQTQRRLLVFFVPCWFVLLLVVQRFAVQISPGTA